MSILRLLLVAPLLWLSTTACSSSDETRDPEQLFTLYRESGFFYWQSEDFKRAEQQILRALEIHPDDFSCNLMLSTLELLKGRTENLLTAEARLETLLDAGDYRVHLGLGQAHERLGIAYQDAANEIASGVRQTQAPDPAARVDELREMAADVWVEANADYETTLDLKPNLADAVNGLQRVHALQGDLEGALVWTNRLIDLVEIDLTYYDSRLAREDITANEEENLRVRMQNSNALAKETYLFGASLLHELDRYATELEYIEKALDIDPDMAKAWSRRAQAEMSVESFDAAIRSLDRFLALSDDPFESPDIQRAYQLREKCEREIREREIEDRLKSLEAGL